MLKRDCQAAVSAKIQKIMHEKKKRPLKQAVAIAFSMVRKASPTCERLLKPQKHQKHSPKQHQKHSPKHQKHSPKHQKHSTQKHSPKHQKHSLRKASPKKH